MKQLITIIILSICSFGYGQKYIHEPVLYQFQDSIFTLDSATNIVVGQEMEIYFNCCFNDSVIIQIDDKIIDNIFLITDKSTSFTGYVLIHRFDKANCKPTMKIILPDKKVFSEIILDNRYKILKINRMEHWDNTWWITFMNCRTIYE